ncbi:MAG: helix-turn-helix domain-containing protein [Acidovorax sp.]|uniref:helix-turn-helix domain-containing protein n=1 Tax=Acidovorax sp. TaxID=1872122 RepID=UPI0039E4D090
MSEVVEGGVTAGALLREARQAAGMHIAALAVSLKVPVSKLEALEADNHAALPDTVFVRALASSVCRTLKIDPGPVLALLPQSHSPRLTPDNAGLNAPFKGSAGGASSSSVSFSGSASRSVVVVVLALLAGAAALFFFPSRQDVSTPSVAQAPALQAEPGEASILATQAAVPAERQTLAPLAVAVASEPMASPAPAPAAAASGAADASASSGTLVLRARSQSWVQVRDATGTVVLQRNLADGESVSVAAPAPLAVVIGRADATEVFVRGKPFDLAPVARDNVARFEVK